MDLAFDPTLDDGLVEDLRRAAADVGLPLERLELLGQDRAVARAFVEAAAHGSGQAMLAHVDWDRLEAVRVRRRDSVRAWVDLLAPEPATAPEGKGPR